MIVSFTINNYFTVLALLPIIKRVYSYYVSASTLRAFNYDPVFFYHDFYLFLY
jgi:hypothetical protein